MYVLVTGANGFVGSQVARALLERGHRARALVRESSDMTLLSGFEGEIAHGDITDPGSIREAMRGVDAVVHSAALVSDTGTAAEFAAANVEGTRNTLEAALHEGVARFVHVSTCDVLGIHRGGDVDDSFPWKKSGYLYSDSKIEAEKLVFEYYRRHGLPVCAARPTFIYGPGDRTVMPVLLEAMKAGMLFYFGSRDGRVSLTYIDDLVDVLLLLLTDERAVGEAFLCSDEEPVRWEWLYAELAGGLGLQAPRRAMPLPLALALGSTLEWLHRVLRRPGRPILSRYAVEWTGSDMTYSPRKLRERLDFRPKVAPAEGLARTIEWLRAQDPHTP